MSSHVARQYIFFCESFGSVNQHWSIPKHVVGHPTRPQTVPYFVAMLGGQPDRGLDNRIRIIQRGPVQPRRFARLLTNVKGVILVSERIAVTVPFRTRLRVGNHILPAAPYLFGIHLVARSTSSGGHEKVWRMALVCQDNYSVVYSHSVVKLSRR